VLTSNIHIAKLIHLLALLCILSLSFLILPASAQERPQVLILHSYHKGVWTDSLIEGIEPVLGAIEGLDIHIEYMDTKKINSAEYYEILREEIRLKFEQITFDVIITSDNNALNFVLGNREILFPSVPVVFCGVNRFSHQMLGGDKNVTGVVEEGDFSATLQVALKMRPHADTIFVITDSTSTSRINFESFKKELTALRRDISVKPLDNTSASQLAEVLSSIPRNDFVFFISYWKDNSGNVISHKSLEKILRKSNVPVFGRSEWMIGLGLTGGKCVSGINQGKTAAELAVKILEGSSTDQIPVIMESPNVYMFDYYEITRHGINRDHLPPDSIIVNSPEPFYRVTKQFAISITISFAILVVLLNLLIINIRQKRKAIEQSRRSEENLRITLHSIGDGVISTDLQGKIIQINPVAEKLTGLRQAQALYRPLEKIFQVFEVNDRSYQDNPIHDVLESGVLHDPAIRILVSSDGEEYHITYIAAPIRASSGEIHGAVLVFRDISKEFILQRQLEQAQKMEAIGTLAGGIAHDFNNLLSVILGYTEMAKIDLQKGSKTDRKLDKVIYGGKRAKDLVQQILAFSRLGERERLPLKPDDAVKEVLQMLRPTIPTTIEINSNIQEGCPQIFADPTQLNQILMNLCTNAYHAMEKSGGKLDISLGEKYFSAEDLVHEPNAHPGTFIHLTVTDTGPGIPPKIQSKIFDPYFTTKQTGKGTGMGLSIIHGIVKSYGGFISLYSEIGKGASFHVFLPVIKGEEIPRHIEEEIDLSGTERLLFVDDEKLLAELGKDMLERYGYEVINKNSGLEALALFQKQPEYFDLVITDQTMPGMTGVELSSRLLEIRPDIKIILCSGYSSIISEEETLSLGIKKFAFKPLTKNDLAKLARMVLDQ